MSEPRDRSWGSGRRNRLTPKGGLGTPQAHPWRKALDAGVMEWGRRGMPWGLREGLKRPRAGVAEGVGRGLGFGLGVRDEDGR